MGADVLIVGGGIIGLTAAYTLAKRGQRVAVYDRGDLGLAASWAGAGIIPPGNAERAATPIDRLRAWSVLGFPGLSVELLETTGVPNEFVRTGGIEFLAPDEMDAVAVWHAENIVAQRLLPPNLHEYEPGVVAPPGTTPVRLPDMANVRNPRHLRALIAGCERRGVKLHPRTAVAGWALTDGRVDGVRLADGTVRRAKTCVIAAGAWADEFLSPLGHPQQVRPIRGQIVLFRANKPVVRHVLIVGKRYLVPRVDGRVLVGSTEEPEAGFTVANTPEGVAELVAFARSLVPALRDAEVEKTWAGLRPGSPEGVPFIGPVPGYDNVYAAVGHHRAGVQLSVGTADLLAALILGTRPPVDPAAFRLDRPPDPTNRPAFRS